MVLRYILNTKVKEEALVEDKDHNNESEMKTQNEDINDMYSDSAKYKDKTRLSEATEEKKK